MNFSNSEIPTYSQFKNDIGKIDDLIYDFLNDFKIDMVF